MADIFWKYATSGQAYVPLLLSSTQNFASTGTVTLASTDATIIKDGSTWAALANTPTAIAMGSKATFEVVWNAAEATAKQAIIQIKDETGGLVQDQQINIVTYGSSLAQHAFNLDQAIENSTMGAVVSVTSDVAGDVVGDVGGNVEGFVVLRSTGRDDISDNVWNEPIAAHGTTNQFGGLIVDNLDANVTSRVASTGVVRANITQIGASTGTFDNLEDDYDGTGFNKANSEIGTAAALTANNDKTGYALASTAQDDLSDVVWNEPIAAHGTTNQFGGLIADNLDANVSSRLATTIGAQLSTTAINAVSTGVKSEINDLVFVDTSSQSTGQPNTGSLGNKIAALNERMFNHHQQDSSTQVVMKTGSTSEVKFAMTVTNTTALQTVQEASTA